MHIIINQMAEIPSSTSHCVCYGHYYANLLAQCGYTGFNPPLAALLSRFHGRQGEWLLASPVHFEATNNGVMITAVDEMLGLKEQEARKLFAFVSQELSEHGLETLYHDAHTWLVRIDEVSAIQSQSVYAMMNQSIMPILSTWGSSFFWQRLLTSLQLSLANSSFAQDHCAVNGVWFWGEGECNALSDSKIWTDDEVLLNLTAHPLPTTRRWHKNDILAIKYPNKVNLGALKQEMSSYTVTWYWNNVAYVTPKRSRWSRLWSK